MTTTKISSDAPDRERLIQLGAESATAPAADSSGRRPRRSGGRPAKPRITAAPDPSPALPAEPVIPRPLMASLIKSPYAIAAKFYGKQWTLSDEEAEGMVDAHLKLADEYLPAWVEENQTLYAVLFLHLLTIAGRFSIGKRLDELLAGGKTETPTASADAGLPMTPIVKPDRPSPFGNVVEDPPGSHPIPGAGK